MNPEIEDKVTTEVIIKKHPIFEVTPLSKYLALALFIIMPFIGALVGYNVSSLETAQMEAGRNQEVASKQAKSTTISTTVEFPIGKTVELEKSAGEFSDLEKPIVTFLKIDSIGDDMAIQVTRLDNEHLHVTAYVSMDVLPSGYIRSFLVKDLTYEIIREITEGPEPAVSGPRIWVLNENMEARLASIEGNINAATKVVLYDYINNIDTILYEEKDANVQLAKSCELGCVGNLSWTGLNTQTLLFERYTKGTWPETTFIETREVELIN
ncbi:MAG: hypothetical protein MUF19_03925 [Candidatus Pacebacteria bacterium]|jgi:hypothetical protein|nr:hypothetical protein [Candidatus Paceibacterota bacterium]